jgi:hypothetical protein
MLHVSRDDRKRVDRQLALDELIASEFGIERDAVVRRVRTGAVPRLAPQRSLEIDDRGWRFLFLLRVILDGVATGWFGASPTPLLMSSLSFLPFAASGRVSRPYGFWVLEGIVHLFLDVASGRRLSFAVSFFETCCCCWYVAIVATEHNAARIGREFRAVL